MSGERKTSLDVVEEAKHVLAQEVASGRPKLALVIYVGGGGDTLYVDGVGMPDLADQIVASVVRALVPYVGVDVDSCRRIPDKKRGSS